jgi:hypothetical protein
VLHELVHGVLHVDGKLWRTLPLLATRSGFLTRDYVEGRRVRYISPVALFLFTIFLTYIVFSSISPDLPENAVVVEGEGRAGEQPSAVRRPDGRVAIGSDTVADAIREARANNQITLDLGDKALEDKANAALANPELLLYKMQQKGYKLAFLLVPMSLPWLWLLFARRPDVQAYDHVVFLLYSISFMSLLWIGAALLLQIGVSVGWIFWLLLVGYPLVHLFLQLKGAYRLSAGGALWRTGFLAASAFATLILYFVLILLLGLLD